MTAPAWLPAAVLGLLALLPAVAQAQSSVGFAEYFVPGDEDQIIASLKTIQNSGVPAGATAANINSVLSIVSSANNVQVFFDTHENGYGFDPADPYNTADAWWGAPANPAGTKQGPTLSRGQVLLLTETNTVVGGANGVDGGDRFYITGAPVSVVRTVFPDDPGAYLSGCWPLFPVQFWQSTYTVPVGEDIAANLATAAISPTDSDLPFHTADLLVQARFDDTEVTVREPNGTLITTTVLDRGESLRIPEVDVGTTVEAVLDGTSDPRPIQANMITGSQQTYNSRYYTLLPDAFVGTEYVVGIPTMFMPSTEYSGRKSRTAAYVYAKENGTSVEITTSAGTTTVPLNANQVHRIQMPEAAANQLAGKFGAHVLSTDPTKKIQVYIAGDDQDPHLDSGHQALPAELLLSDYFVPYAIGNPLHVTPLYDNTQINFDFNADGIVDRTYTLNRLDTRMVYDPDLDATGAHVWGTKPFQLVWSQDNSEFTPGERTTAPETDRDQGYTILPLSWFDPQIAITHTEGTPALPAAGGTVTFTIVVETFTNDVYNIDVTSLMPANWTYELGSTIVTYSDGSPGNTTDPGITGQLLSWPLDKDLPPGETITILYDATAAPAAASGLHVLPAVAIGTNIANESDPLAIFMSPQDNAEVLKGGTGTTLTLTKTSNAMTRTSPTDPITYTLVATNTGTEVAPNVILEDILPPTLTYVPNSTALVARVDGAYDRVADWFQSNAYNLNMGNVNWRNNNANTSWVETGDSSGATGGSTRVISFDGSGRLRVGGPDRTVYRPVNLANAVNPTLRFVYRRVDLDDANDNIMLRISTNNGGSFTDLATYAGPGNDATWQAATFDLSPFAGNNNVRIYFDTSGTLDTSDYLYVDNIEVEYTSRQTVNLVGGAPPILAEGLTLYPGESLTATFQALIVQPVPNNETALINNATVYSQNSAPVSDDTNDPLGAIGDFVFIDLNGNSIHDVGTDEFATGVIVDLRERGADLAFGTGDDIVYPGGTVNGSGIYSITGLSPGVYRAFPRVSSLPAGGIVTSTNPVNITLTAGQTNLTADFVIQLRANIEGVVFADANGNGFQDPGDVGIGGVDIVVDPFYGSQVTATTLADGTWEILNIAVGDAEVDVDENDLHPSVLQTAGTDPTTVNVPRGGTGTTLDGYQQQLPQMTLNEWPSETGVPPVKLNTGSGSTFVYVVDFANISYPSDRATAFNVVIGNTLPRQAVWGDQIVLLQQVVFSAGYTGSVNVSNGVITINLDQNVPPGESGSVFFTVKTADPVTVASLVNVARLDYRDENSNAMAQLQNGSVLDTSVLRVDIVSAGAVLLASNLLEFRWTTGAEFATVGFEVYRLSGLDRDKAMNSTSTLITPVMIDAQGSPVEGASYSVIDPLPYAKGQVRGFLLVETEISGSTLQYGPYWYPSSSATSTVEDWMLF